MSDSAQHTPNTSHDSRPPQEPADEYPLQPDEPAGAADLRPVPSVDPGGSADNPEDRQFSLGELLGLVAVVAVILSILSSIGRWMGIDKSPGSLAALHATGLGFLALIAMVVLAYLPNVRRIVLVGWWVLLAAYVITAVAAVLMPR